MPEPVDELRARHSAKRLLLPFFGEFLLQDKREQVRTKAVIHALEGSGVKAAATRAALERNVRRGLLARTRQGREVSYSLTPRAERVLREAQTRVHSAHPFRPTGPGWSLVLFSLPEESQPTRHRLRSALAWEGFAPFGRGAWIAPGEVDFAALRHAMPRDVPNAVIAFQAHVAAGFEISDTVTTVWDVPAIAAAHHRFAANWHPRRNMDAASPIAMRTALIADWLDLLRQDPRLHPQHLPDNWPAEESHRLFLLWHARLVDPSERELQTLLEE